mmetsp:Transcript_2610/g.2893  ORF Transcript_2610/g.2893 Transcript_2610/m.2893 type:complete len:91 (+) Transcript_2610:416-688(+)
MPMPSQTTGGALFMLLSITIIYSGLMSGMPRRLVTALRCASSPSTEHMVATWGPNSFNPSSVNSWTVMCFWKESNETPLYIFAYPYVGST